MSQYNTEQLIALTELSAHSGKDQFLANILIPSRNVLIVMQTSLVLPKKNILILFFEITLRAKDLTTGIWVLD